MSYGNHRSSSLSPHHSSLLSGLQVWKCGEGIAVGYAGKLVADLGAEVVRLERPRVGDGLRYHGLFVGDTPHRERGGLSLYLHAAKRSVALSLESMTGTTILRQLAATVDIMLEGFPAGYLTARGLGFETLQASNAGLVLTSISPFGQTGPDVYLPASDITVCAAAGITYSVGSPGREPLTPPLFQSAYQAGMGGAAATAPALLARDTAGVTQHADVSALEIFATIHSRGAALRSAVWQGWRAWSDIRMRRC
jgi:crotonobetainyl-CoA:carnitine CoA-transferase CaiB-like acyl-CoA transferase